MAEEYLYTDKDKDNATKKFRTDTLGDGQAKTHAKQTASQREKERDQADDNQRDRQRADTAVAHAGKGDANGQGVYAGGHGKQQLRANMAGVETVLLAVAKGVKHHPATDISQQAKGYPMVIVLQICPEKTYAKPSQQGHASLKKSEQNSHGEHCTVLDALHNHSADNRHDETVHGQRNSQQYKFNSTHHK